MDIKLFSNKYYNFLYLIKGASKFELAALESKVCKSRTLTHREFEILIDNIVEKRFAK